MTFQASHILRQCPPFWLSGSSNKSMHRCVDRSCTDYCWSSWTHCSRSTIFTWIHYRVGLSSKYLAFILNLIASFPAGYVFRAVKTWEIPPRLQQVNNKMIGSIRSMVKYDPPVHPSHNVPHSDASVPQMNCLDLVTLVVSALCKVTI